MSVNIICPFCLENVKSSAGLIEKIQENRRERYAIFYL